MKLHQLNKLDVFTFAEHILPHGESVPIPQKAPTIRGKMIFLGMDGMYAKVKHTDKKMNKKLAALYDDGAEFFCLVGNLEVDKVEDPYLDEYGKNK